jgi:hypothetical protein
MRVLLFTPCERLEPETLAAIFALHYDGPLDRMFTHDNPDRVQIYENIIYNYRKAQRIFLAEQYDALLIVENDIIPPPDALEKLLAVEADIAYGVYALRRGIPQLNVRHPQTHKAWSQHKAEWREKFGQVIDIAGIGFGCTLIHRNVLETLELRATNGGDGDTQLANDARAYGFTQKADTTVLCGHKRPDGVILWPGLGHIRQEGISRPPMCDVRALTKFSGWDESNHLYIAQPGERRRVRVEMAQELVSVGMAEYVQGQPSFEHRV